MNERGCKIIPDVKVGGIQRGVGQMGQDTAKFGILERNLNE